MWHRIVDLVCIYWLDTQLVRFGRRSVDCGCVYNEVYSLGMVEEIEKPDGRLDNELGGCHRVRAGRRLFCQPVFFSELCDPLFVLGKVASRGRLPFRKQDELWTSYSSNAVTHAVDVTYDSRPEGLEK